MLENASQTIACDFDVSQEFWNVPSQVYIMPTCGWAYTMVCPYLHVVYMAFHNHRYLCAPEVTTHSL